MSDQLRDLVQPFGDVEPPLDLHNRITARERELTVSVACPGILRACWYSPWQRRGWDSCWSRL